MIDTFLYAIEIIGVISFSVSGALVAIDRETDWFGVVFLAVVTAFGGGIIRDLIIGNTPPAFFVSMPTLVTISICTSLIIFILAFAFKRAYVKNEEAMKNINNIFDAAGISAFAVSGVRICLDTCPEGGAFLAIMMGMISAVGGGMIRDMILRDIPFILRKHVYALACIVGATVYYVLSVHLFGEFEFGEVVARILGILAVFTIRMFATVFKWNMPKAIIFSRVKAEEKEEEVHTVTK